MIEKIIIIALIVQFIHYTMKEGEIFSFIGNWLYNILPIKLRNPFFECAVCMTPWYGSIIYWAVWHGQYIIHRNAFYGHGEWMECSFSEWIIVIFAASGLNIILNAIIHSRVDGEIQSDDKNDLSL